MVAAQQGFGCCLYTLYITDHIHILTHTVRTVQQKQAADKCSGETFPASLNVNLAPFSSSPSLTLLMVLYGKLLLKKQLVIKCFLKLLCTLQTSNPHCPCVVCPVCLLSFQLVFLFFFKYVFSLKTASWGEYLQDGRVARTLLLSPWNYCLHCAMSCSTDH